jgi:hypothetical protein
MTGTDIRRQLAETFSDERAEKAVVLLREAWGAELGQDAKQSDTGKWLRNWGFYQEFLEAPVEVQDQVIEMVLGLTNSKGIRNMGAVLAFEVICAILTRGQLSEREQVMAAAQQLAKDTGFWSAAS